jgi:hypothetical protein
MSEPGLIRSGAPHEVSVAPGSTVAKSRSASPRETVIRQNVAGEPEYVDVVDPVERDTLAIGKPRVDVPHTSEEAVVANRGRLFTAEPTKPPPVEDEAGEIAPEMNFPARLIHLKIENDKMRSMLDGLEQGFKAS